MQNGPDQPESLSKEEATWHETRGTASIGRILLGVAALVILLWLLDTCNGRNRFIYSGSQAALVD